MTDKKVIDSYARISAFIDHIYIGIEELVNALSLATDVKNHENLAAALRVMLQTSSDLPISEINNLEWVGRKLPDKERVLVSPIDRKSNKAHDFSISFDLIQDGVTGRMLLDLRVFGFDHGSDDLLPPMPAGTNLEEDVEKMFEKYGVIQEFLTDSEPTRTDTIIEWLTTDSLVMDFQLLFEKAVTSMYKLDPKAFWSLQWRAELKGTDVLRLSAESSEASCSFIEVPLKLTLVDGVMKVAGLDQGDLPSFENPPLGTFLKNEPYNTKTMLDAVQEASWIKDGAQAVCELLTQRYPQVPFVHRKIEWRGHYGERNTFVIYGYSESSEYFEIKFDLMTRDGGVTKLWKLSNFQSKIVPHPSMQSAWGGGWGSDVSPSQMTNFGRPSPVGYGSLGGTWDQSRPSLMGGWAQPLPGFVPPEYEARYPDPLPGAHFHNRSQFQRLQGANFMTSAAGGYGLRGNYLQLAVFKFEQIESEIKQLVNQAPMHSDLVNIISGLMAVSDAHEYPEQFREYFFTMEGDWNNHNPLNVVVTLTGNDANTHVPLFNFTLHVTA